MCGIPDVVAEQEHLDETVLSAFWEFKGCMQEYFDIEEEPDWIKAFGEGVCGRLRELEKEGKLTKWSSD